MTPAFYQLSGFPVLVDPGAAALEVKAVEPTSGRAWWLTLPRLRVAHDSFGIVLGDEMVHFFGDRLDPAACRVAMFYDAWGRLGGQLARTARGWDVWAFSPEQTGRPALLPGVRTAFPDPAAATAFRDAIVAVRATAPGSRAERRRLADLAAAVRRAHVPDTRPTLVATLPWSPPDDAA